MQLPQNIVCGYCHCSEFGMLKVSPERVAVKYEIELYLEDGLSTYTNGEEIKIRKHYIRITCPGQRRYSRLPFVTSYIKFDAEGEIAQLLEGLSPYFRCVHPRKFCKLIDEIVLLSEEGVQKLLLQARILELLELVRTDAQLSVPVSVADYGLISEAKRYMRHHLEERVCLHDVAAFVNLSDIYFHGLFKSTTGMTPHEYLTECRFDCAKKMLWDRENSMERIAENCGFSSQQHFAKSFKKAFGLTPSAYRKEFQQRYME